MQTIKNVDGRKKTRKELDNISCKDHIFYLFLPKVSIFLNQFLFTNYCRSCNSDGYKINTFCS